MTTASDAVEAVNLFRTIGRQEMLPVALYLCSVLPNSTLVRGDVRGDGSQEQLSPDDMVRCLEGRDQLCRQGTRFFYAVFGAEVAQNCTTPDRCALFVQAWQRQLRSPQFEGMLGHTVLHEFCLPLIEATRKTGELCTHCLERLTTSHEQLQRDIWRKLPKIFGLEVAGWPTE